MQTGSHLFALVASLRLELLQVIRRPSTLDDHAYDNQDTEYATLRRFLHGVSQTTYFDWGSHQATWAQVGTPGNCKPDLKDMTIFLWTSNESPKSLWI